MTITEVKAEYVFTQRGKGVDMAGLTVQRCQQLVSEADSCKFYNVTQ